MITITGIVVKDFYYNKITKTSARIPSSFTKTTII